MFMCTEPLKYQIAEGPQFLMLILAGRIKSGIKTIILPTNQNAVISYTSF